MERHSGTNIQSGDGITTAFSIPHGCKFEPYFANVIALSQDALYDFHMPTAIPFEITWDATNINLNFFVLAPTLGTNNLKFSWEAECK